MTPLTAMALCLLASAIVLSSRRGGIVLARLAQAAFILTLALAALTLLDHTGVIPSPTALFGEHPMHIAPLAAVCLLLSAGAGLMLHGQQRWQIWLFSLATTLSGFLALLTLVGHVLGLSPFAWNSTSALSALGLFALALSLIFARPHIQLTAIFFSDSTGGMMARRLLPAALLLPLLIAFLVRLGETAGFYDASAGVSVAALIFLVSFTSLVAWSAHALHRVGLALQGARKEVEQLNFSLEQKVAHRTADLQMSNLHLQKEIAERQTAERELSQYRGHLEEIVAQRTNMLAQANLQLLDEIARRKLIERKLSEQKERAQVTLASIGDAVITTDAQGNVVYLNPVAESLCGWDAGEARGKPIAAIIRLLNEATRSAVENPALACLRKYAEATVNNTNLLLRRGGGEIPVADSAAPIRDREQNTIGAVVVMHDVTKERRLTQQLSYQASHDALTGLVNRQEFEKRVDRVLASAKTHDTQHALLFLDLDHFKQVNDSSGHAAGDALLRQIPGLFKQCIRQRDTLARLGGDEFGLLLEQCTLGQAESVADTLLNLSQGFVFQWQDHTHQIGLSIGLVAINQDSGNLSSLLSAADAACYASKHGGRNRYSIYANSGSH